MHMRVPVMVSNSKSPGAICDDRLIEVSASSSAPPKGRPVVGSIRAGSFSTSLWMR